MCTFAADYRCRTLRLVIDQFSINMHWRSGQSRVKREGSRFGTTDRIRKLQSPTESLGNPSNCRGCGQGPRNRLRGPLEKESAGPEPVQFSVPGLRPHPDSHIPGPRGQAHSAVVAAVVLLLLLLSIDGDRWIGGSVDLVIGNLLLRSHFVI